MNSLDPKILKAYNAVREPGQKPFRSCCYAPFVSLFFTTHGKVLACCKNGSFVLGDVQQQRLSDIWNGERAVQLREALKQDNFGLGCDFCRWEISGGNYHTATPLLFDEVPVQSNGTLWPSQIEFEGSNVCNFECIMCNGDTSSLIRAHRDGLPPLPKAYPDQFFEDLREFLPHLKRGRFFGGEPFLTSESLRIWEMMISDGLSTECHVTTNGSQYNSRVERVLENLPFHITVSIDGITKETVESIRVNCRFEQLMENIHRFRDYAKRRGTSFQLAFCLMRQNWQEFGDLLLFGEDIGCRVFVNTVIDPLHCSLYALPLQELKCIHDQLAEQGKTIADRLRLNRQAWDEALLKLQSATGTSQMKEMATVLSTYFVPDDPLHRALELVDHDRYQDALAEISSVAENDPDYYYVASLSGYIKILLDDLEGTDRDLQTAFQLSTKRPEAYLNLARLRIKQKRYQEALEQARHARKLSKPEDRLEFESRELLALLNMRQGNLLESIRNLKSLATLQTTGSEVQSLVYPKNGLRKHLLSEISTAPYHLPVRMQLVLLTVLLSFLRFALKTKLAVSSIGRSRHKLSSKTDWKHKFRKTYQQFVHDFQLLRLKLDRIMTKRFRPDQFRILSTACWSFPVYSQTFVYQELTQLIRHGFQLRFVYSRLDSRKHLPSQFSTLWRTRRRLSLHPELCRRDYEYFTKRMPGKVKEIIELVSKHSGIKAEELVTHHHFLEAFAFSRMAEAYQPDYLHSYFFYEGTYFTFIASYLLDIPRGVSCYADHMLKDYDLKMVPLHLDQCRLVIATSQRIKQELVQIAPGANPNKIMVKPNAIDAVQFPVTPRKDPTSAQPFQLVTVSRIEPKKGLVYLVEAVRMLRDRQINVHLSVIGGVDKKPETRDYNRELTDRIAELQLGDVVHLEGTKTDKEIRQFFVKSQIFVAPFVQTEQGDKDGIPTSLLEGMASGLPIVATDAGSIPEVIENGKDGVIVDQRNPKALAKAIEQLIQDPSRRKDLGESASRKIREKFAVDVCEQPFHDRLRRLLTIERKISHVKTSTSLVSIVTPFLNAEKFLEEAIDSILEQTYQNWELFLVDDGSTDRSVEIARRYANQYPEKIFYIDHEGHKNLGAAASRNVGLRRAKGEYVAVLDSDDVWLPHKLERQVAIMEAEPGCAMVIGSSRYWHSWSSTPDEQDHVPELGIEPDTMYEPPSLVQLLYPLGKGCPPSHSDLFLRRSAVTGGAMFEEQYKGIYFLYEDQAFLAKVYLHHPVYISSECWDLYRIHADSCVATVQAGGHYQTVRGYFLKWYESYMSEQGFKGTHVWEVLQSAIVAEQQPETELRQTMATSQLDPVQWGSLRRATPVSADWGNDRGLPIDRYYIEKFLGHYAEYIQGHVLEFKDSRYSSKFGNSRVRKLDILHAAEGNALATIVADLTRADHIPSNHFDCVLLTQVLHFIYDFRSALRTIHRILKPGGILLATLPGITRISFDESPDTYLWTFTSASSRRLFETEFSGGTVDIQTHGNVLSATAFLQGIAAGELTQEELNHWDPRYEVIITVRAIKSNA